MNEVITRTSCKRCGKVEERQGSFPDTLPEGWNTLHISPLGNEYRLCLACTKLAEKFINPPKIGRPPRKKAKSFETTISIEGASVGTKTGKQTRKAGASKRTKKSGLSLIIETEPNGIYRFTLGNESKETTTLFEGALWAVKELKISDSQDPAEIIAKLKGQPDCENRQILIGIFEGAGENFEK